VSDSSPSNDPRPWDNVPPMGIFRPLSPRLVAGQTASSGELLQPLGGRSLTILQPRLFLSDSQALALPPTLPFEESPFFNTTEWRSPRPPQTAPSPLSPQPDRPDAGPTNLALSTSVAHPSGLTEQTPQAGAEPRPLSSDQAGDTPPASAMAPHDVPPTAAAESAAVTDPNAGSLRRRPAETDVTTSPLTTPLNDLEEPSSPVEPGDASPTATEFPANTRPIQLTPSEPPASDAEPFTDSQSSAIPQSSESTSTNSQVDSTADEWPPTPPASNVSAASAARSPEFVQRSPSPPEHSSPLADAAGEAEIRSEATEATETTAEPFPSPPTAADVSAADFSSTVSPSPSAMSHERPPAEPPRPPQSQPQDEGPAASGQLGDPSDSVTANEFSQASPLTDGPDIQPPSVDSSDWSGENRFPETDDAGGALPTESRPPLSAESQIVTASDSPTAEPQSPTADLQRRSDRRDRPSSPTTTASAAASQTATPTDPPGSPNASAQRSESRHNADSTARDIAEAASPPEPLTNRTTASSPLPPTSPAASAPGQPPAAPIAAPEQPAANRPPDTSSSETTEVQRSPTQPSPSSHLPTGDAAAASTAATESLAASAPPSPPITNQPEELPSPTDGPSVPSASSSNPSAPLSETDASEPVAQRQAMTDAAAASDPAAANLSSPTADSPFTPPSLTDSSGPVISSLDADQPGAGTATPPLEASEPSQSLQPSLTESTAQHPESVSSTPGASPTMPIENEVHPGAEAENAIPTNQLPLIPGTSPPVGKTTELAAPAAAAETIPSTSQPPLDMATTADSITPQEEPSAPVQRQTADAAEMGVSESSVNPELRSPNVAEPLPPDTSVSSSVDQGSQTTVPFATSDDRPDFTAASEQFPTTAEPIAPNQSSVSGAAIQLTPSADDLPDASATPNEAPHSTSLSESEAAVSEASGSEASETPRSPHIPTDSSAAVTNSRSLTETVADAAANRSETSDRPLHDRGAAVQRDSQNLAAPSEAPLPSAPAAAQEAATRLPAGPSPPQSEPKATDTTNAGEPIPPTLPEDASRETAADLSQPFLVGDTPIQRSVALPTVMADLSPQTLWRSPQTLLFSGDSQDSASAATQPGSQPTASLAAEQQRRSRLPQEVNGAAESISISDQSGAPVLQPSSPSAEGQSAHKGPDQPGRSSPLPVAASAYLATPQAWDSIEDLLTQLPPSTPTPQVSAASQRESVTAAAPETTFTNLQAAEIPAPVIQRRAAPAPAQPIQRLATESPAPDSTWAADRGSETAASTSETSENLEKLAALMYRMVRQRLAIERERLGRSGSGRF